MAGSALPGPSQEFPISCGVSPPLLTPESGHAAGTPLMEEHVGALILDKTFQHPPWHGRASSCRAQHSQAAPGYEAGCSGMCSME